MSNKLEATAKQQILRDALFVPCTSMEHLHLWIKTYLGVDLPSNIVCDDDPAVESTNSSPMRLVWELYSKAREGTDENFQRVLAYAARGAYKCVEKGTLVRTKSGLAPIENLKVGDVVWTGWSWKPIQAHIHDGVKSSVSVTLTNGMKLTTSPIHRVWAWEPGRAPDWKKVSELSENDLVCIDTSIHSDGQGFNQEDFNKGYLCGILTGDGCLTRLEEREITLSASDQYVLEFWQRQCLMVAGRAPKQSTSRPYDYKIDSAVMRDYLKSLGLSSAYSWQKRVPESCLTSPSSMAGFISGLLDTDGSVTGRGDIVLSITAKDVISQTQVMLLALGVSASIRTNKRLYGKQNHIIHTLTVNRNDLNSLSRAGIRFNALKANTQRPATQHNTLDSIPSSHVAALLGALPCKPEKRPRGCAKVFKPKLSPNYETYSRGKLVDLLDWAKHHGYLSEADDASWREIFKNRWVKVKTLETGTADFYDLSVEGEPSYWSNGFISHNTLACSIIEVLALLHLGRNVAHAAAIETQAAVAGRYVENFFKRPILRDFLDSKNKRTIEVTRYIDKEGHSITKDAWKLLSFDQQLEYTQKTNWMKIVVATMGGFNAIHAPLIILDELDLVDPGPLKEVNGVPCSGENGELPIIFMTSSRKFSFGEVQKVLDNAHKTNTAVRHWNIIDVGEKCPPHRHLPEKPKLPIYYNANTLGFIRKEEWELLAEDEKDQWTESQGFEGCLTNCTLYAICRGRLAEKQNDKSKLLISIPEIKIKTVGGVEFTKSQLMGWKPSSEGLIYPNLNRNRHMLTAGQMYSKISGEVAPPGFGKANLLAYFLSRPDISFHVGGDWGYTHFFALTVGALDGNRLFIFDALGVPGLEVNQKIELCKSKYKVLDASWYLDPEDRSSVESFRRAGFRCKKFDKDVLLGIDAVRHRIMPGLNADPLIYFLQGDPGVEALFSHMTRYHWVIDLNSETPTAVPDERDDDMPDSCRYLCQNLHQGGAILSFGGLSHTQKAIEARNPNASWLTNKVRELTGGETGTTIVGKKGSFQFKP